MSIKIAVGSSNGIIIDQHFGSGKKFYIFELLEDGTSNFIETREPVTEEYNEVSSSCSIEEQASCGSGNTGCGCSSGGGGHDELGLLGKVNLLLDCQAVLVNQIGKGAERLLLKKGISAFEAKDTIEKAFSKLFIYYKRSKQL